MSSERRGFKLHSIIEKLSEQCGRGSPSHVTDEESEDSGSHTLSDPAEASSKRKSQRKGAVKRVKKDNVCEIVDSEEEEFNSDHSSLYTVEIPTYNSTDTADNTGEDYEWISRNYGTEKRTRRRRPKKIKNKPLPKRVLKQRRYAVLAAWKKKNAQERQARLALETPPREKAAARGLHTTDNDLCIDVASFVKLGAQMEDIDHASPLERCWFCEQGPFEGQESLSTHIEENHPDICLVRRKNIREQYSDSDEDEEVVERVKTKEDENRPKGSVMTEGRRSSLRVQHLGNKPLYEELSAFKQMVSNNVQVITQQDQNQKLKRMQYSRTTETEAREMEDTMALNNDFVETESVDDDLCISVPDVIAMPIQVQDIDNDPMWLPSDKESTSEPEPEQREPYKCNKCGETSLEKEWRKQHLREHPECRPEFKCEVCGKIMHWASSYSKHLATHRNERPYKCDVCESTFKDKSYLKRHMVTHTGHKKYQCDKCDKCFAHRGSLKQHLNRHAGFRPFKCDKCDEAFYTRSGLTSHEMQHTGETPFTCDKCGKGFAKSYGLRMHMTSHSDIKPFKCEICSKAFKRKDHLREHRIIHSDDKPHKCETCGRTFNQHVCLRKHLPCREAERQEKREQRRKEKEIMEKEKGGKRTRPAADIGIKTGKKLVDKKSTSKEKENPGKVKRKKKTGAEKDKSNPKKRHDEEGNTRGEKSSVEYSPTSAARKLQAEQTGLMKALKPLSTSCVGGTSALNTPCHMTWSAAQNVGNETAVSSVSRAQQSSISNKTSHSCPVSGVFPMSASFQLCSPSTLQPDNCETGESHNFQDTSSLGACPPLLSPSHVPACVESNSIEQQSFIPFSAGGAGLNFFSQEALEQLVSHTGSSALSSQPLTHEPTTELGQVLMSTLDTDDNFLL